VAAAPCGQHSVSRLGVTRILARRLGCQTQFASAGTRSFARHRSPDGATFAASAASARLPYDGDELNLKSG